MGVYRRGALISTKNSERALICTWALNRPTTLEIILQKEDFFFSKSKQQWDGKSKTSSILFFTRGIDGLFAKKIRLVFKVNHWLLFAKKVGIIKVCRTWERIFVVVEKKFLMSYVLLLKWLNNSNVQSDNQMFGCLAKCGFKSLWQ